MYYFTTSGPIVIMYSTTSGPIVIKYSVTSGPTYTCIYALS